MAKKKPLTRKQLGTRASAIRKKRDSGKTITSAESRELASFEASKRPSKRGKSATTSPTKPRAESEPDTTESEPDTKQDSPKDSPGDTYTKKPPPPKVLNARTGKAGGDWRDKYRSEAGAMGREETCVLLGNVWCNSVLRLALYVQEDLGKTPVFSPDNIHEDMRPTFILATDALIPKELEVTPELLSASVSSIMLAQAGWLKFKAGKKKKVEPVVAAAEREREAKRAAQQKSDDEKQRAARKPEEKPPNEADVTRAAKAGDDYEVSEDDPI